MIGPRLEYAVRVRNPRLIGDMESLVNRHTVNPRIKTQGKTKMSEFF